MTSRPTEGLQIAIEPHKSIDSDIGQISPYHLRKGDTFLQIETKRVKPPLPRAKLTCIRNAPTTLPYIPAKHTQALRPACRYYTSQKPIHCDPQQSNGTTIFDHRGSPQQHISLVYSKPQLKHGLRSKGSALQNYKKANLSHFQTTRPSIELNATQLPSQLSTMLDETGRVSPTITKAWTKTELVNTIEAALENASENFEEFEGLSGKFKTAAEKLLTIEKENAMIRYHLRTLNELLTILLPFKNQELYRRKQNVKAVPEESPEVMQLISQNYDKWLGYYKVDYEHYLRRLEQVKDSSYPLALKERCSELDREIMILMKRIQNYQDPDKLYRYKINRIVKENEIGARSPKKGDSNSEIAGLGNECEAVRSQLAVNDAKLFKGKEKIDAMNERIKLAKEKWDRLVQEANALRIRYENTGKSETEIECQELIKGIGKIHKDAAAIRNRMIVHDKDQRKTIMELEEKIEAAKYAISSKAELVQSQQSRLGMLMRKYTVSKSRRQSVGFDSQSDNSKRRLSSMESNEEERKAAVLHNEKENRAAQKIQRVWKIFVKRVKSEQEKTLLPEKKNEIQAEVEQNENKAGIGVKSQNSPKPIVINKKEMNKKSKEVKELQIQVGESLGYNELPKATEINKKKGEKACM